LTATEKVGPPRRRWLITGAAGFIGSNLARFLLERGESVVGFDNFFSGKRANIDRLGSRFALGFSFIEGDILDAASVAAAANECVVVVHLAAQVSVVRSIDDPEENHAINGTGFLNTYRAAAAGGASRFVYASSCAVYGDNPAIPLSEEAEPHPLSPYAATKLANEAYASGMAITARSMKAVGLRFFNVFGAWQDAEGGYAAVIPKWIDLLLAAKDPVLYGDGTATRDFCHIDNICDAIWRAAECEMAESHNVYNVGTGVSTRLDGLYNSICRVLRKGGCDLDMGAPAHLPERGGEIKHSVADTRKSDVGLGFRANVDLEEGLCRMLAEQYGLTFAAGSWAANNGAKS